MINITDFFKEELVVMMLFLFGYLIYFFSIDSKILNKIRDLRTAKGKVLIREAYLQKIIGFVTLGIIPFILTMAFFGNVCLYGLPIPSGDNLLLWCGIPIAFFLLGSFLPRNNINTDFYPQARIKKWRKKDIIINSLIWILYLLGYEYMFRGLMFFTLLNAYGLAAAVIIISVIYSLVHIYKGKMEAFGAFFLGIVLCIITYYTNSMWVALIIHIILALGNDFKAIKLSDEIEYI